MVSFVRGDCQINLFTIDDSFVMNEMVHSLEICPNRIQGLVDRMSKDNI